MYLRTARTVGHFHSTINQGSVLVMVQVVVVIQNIETNAYKFHNWPLHFASCQGCSGYY